MLKTLDEYVPEKGDVVTFRNGLRVPHTLDDSDVRLGQTLMESLRQRCSRITRNGVTIYERDDHAQ